MNDPRIEPGYTVLDRDDEEIGRVDAVFADYLLVRAGFPPVDVHVPTASLVSTEDETVRIDATRDDVRRGIWDRPPVRPHDDSAPAGAESDTRRRAR